ncbi:MAG TPA: glycosyltransferase family protein [Spirochaetota bacterium]|nr:acylneuraminate cytidylyltransferase [Spirochaetota bacterium]HQO38874.1 glycosyltransferase family protein [Spirochaetota bacterium]
MKTVAVIQARIASTRLAAKAMLPLAGKPMIVHVIERALAIKGVCSVILATGISAANDPLEKIAADCGVVLFRGSEDNVLERFYLAVKNRGFDYIIRITGDNPLTDHVSASAALHYACDNKFDHCSVSGIPLGTGIEIVSMSALERAYRESSNPYHFEHVTPYIKEHPGFFSTGKYSPGMENPFPELRLTVDTPEDFDLMGKIYKALYRDRPILLTEVITFLMANPDLVNINSHVEQRPMTHSSNV